eukprot:1517568-Prorocentrum_lima.AAC.1
MWSYPQHSGQGSSNNGGSSKLAGGPGQQVETWNETKLHHGATNRAHCSEGHKGRSGLQG